MAAPARRQPGDADPTRPDNKDNDMPLSLIKNTSARLFINHFMAEFGEVTELAIDSDDRSITARIALRGEVLPVEVRAVRYRIEEDGLVIEQFACERDWIATVLNRFLAGHKLTVPKGVGMFALNAML